MFRVVKFIEGHYYHIYNRGTDKRDIFLSNSDYLRFFTLLYICNSAKPTHLQNLLNQGRSLMKILEITKEKDLIAIGSYCLMPNHFHLLVKEKENNGISNFMKKLSTAYAMYFNKKYERNGNLFQGRFKAELADKDEYLKYLFAYIHLNPIKLIEPEWKEKGIKNPDRTLKFLENYQWSSYAFYAHHKQKNPILKSKEFPQYFENFNDFKIFIDEWLNYQVK